MTLFEQFWQSSYHKWKANVKNLNPQDEKWEMQFFFSFLSHFSTGETVRVSGKLSHESDPGSKFCRIQLKWGQM